MAVRFAALSLLSALLLLAGCGSDHKKRLDRDAEMTSDVEAGTGEEEEEPEPPPPETDDGAVEEEDVDAGLDSGVDSDASVIDAAAPDADAGPEVDAAPPAPNPLAGKYAARTQLYARQKSNIGETELDLVSKGVLISVVEIDTDGDAHEQYCIFEISGEIFSWMPPAAVQAVVPTSVPLVAQADGFARPASAHTAPLSWAPTGAPADCVAGQPHASGCVCPSAGAPLPVVANDCRVRDLDHDLVPGTDMYIGLAPSEDLSAEGAMVTLNVAATVSIGWKLPGVPSTRMVGQVQGGFEQAELSREISPDLPIETGPILNAMCPGELGHIELVKGEFDCAALLARRAQDPTDLDLFDLTLDAEKPLAPVCPDPACGADDDGDGSANCHDECDEDPAKTAPGVCGCGKTEADGDSDGALDCNDGCPQDPQKRAPGSCGCGAVEADADEDQTADCLDLCPADASKTKPLICGCGVSDADDDQDGTPNCNETCDADPHKTAPGLCDCGTADTNTDGDSEPDCRDECPANAPKVKKGICDCATADEDRDHDNTPDCNDACPDDGGKNTLGLCGCGVAETDRDGDKTPDCVDQCADHAGKTQPGACGCAVADTDTDRDDRPDCIDQCVEDPKKITPGQCGCGVIDADADNDGTPSCRDQCDQDRTKTAPGICGCGVPDADTDGDTVLDCRDGCSSDKNKTAPGTCGCGVVDRVPCTDECPNDPLKVAPGLCGCGNPDTNADGDSQPVCRDACDNDPGKLAPLQCGCGKLETDSDDDKVADCNDACPNDPLKSGSTVCSCGVPDVDTDKDGAFDCLDECPTDPGKKLRGVCDCGTPETNSDSDPTPDCKDLCKNDGTKIAPGVCGCGVPETNSDTDSTPDCKDGCKNDGTKTEPGLCGCGVPDTNSDTDTTPDCNDQCKTDGNKIAPGVCGCGVADVDTDHDTFMDCKETCDNNAQMQEPGPCGCEACAASPLLGTYAVRTNVFSKQRNGNTIEQTQGINYSVITIAAIPGGGLQLTDRQCWQQTIPSGGSGAYAWSKPAWVQAIPAAVRNLTWNVNGTFTRPAVLTRYGWDPAQQPSTCTPTSTPIRPGFRTAWGSTCVCNAPASSMPPYDKSVDNYDCRVVDTDGDGQPGISSVASLSGEPAVGAEDANGLVTAYGVSNVLDTWTITPGTNGNHTAIIEDQSVAQIIGCPDFLPCLALPASPPPSRICDAIYNKASFVKVAANTTCSTVLSQRATLWGANPPWPTAQQCPAP